MFYSINEQVLYKKTVIIGDSLQNGFIVMICDGNNDGVYYYDDSYYFDESNDENNVYIISNNFTEFLDMIVKRKLPVCQLAL